MVVVGGHDDRIAASRDEVAYRTDAAGARLARVAHRERRHKGIRGGVFRAAPVGAFGERGAARRCDGRLDERQGRIELTQLPRRRQIPAVVVVHRGRSVLAFSALQRAQDARVAEARQVAQGVHVVERHFLQGQHIGGLAPSAALRGIVEGHHPALGAVGVEVEHHALAAVGVGDDIPYVKLCISERSHKVPVPHGLECIGRTVADYLPAFHPAVEGIARIGRSCQRYHAAGRIAALVTRNAASSDRTARGNDGIVADGNRLFIRRFRLAAIVVGRHIVGVEACWDIGVGIVRRFQIVGDASGSVTIIAIDIVSEVRILN